MASSFQSIHFNVVDRAEDDLKDLKVRPLALRNGGVPQPVTPVSDPKLDSEEAAARHYLSRLFGRDSRSTVRGLTESPGTVPVPDMRLQSIRRSRLSRTCTVGFVQTVLSVPIFGSRAVVELDRNCELLGIDAQIAAVKGVGPHPDQNPRQALEGIAKFAAVDVASLQGVAPPELTYFHEEDKDVWHLAYYFRNVPAAPPGFVQGMRSHGMQPSHCHHHPELDYLVDAHDGAVFLFWSSAPTLDVPAQCRGLDEEGVSRPFYGSRTSDVFEMSDPLRCIRTFDFGLKDVDTDPPPSDPVCETSNEFRNRAAVSAHCNATRVYDFYKSVLMRDGVDDKGTELISYVNCTFPAAEVPPNWHNATWWKRCMWYGQADDGSGNLRSFARFIDVIAHELTHGVTEFTADLIYFRQSGALNESFSDIFGVIIKNWDVAKPDTGGDPSDWNWEIGPGLGPQGRPLRDMKDPARTGDPDHMANYLETLEDNGGVHKNSNIHNKAAYHVLTAVDGDGQQVFSPREVAVLYYLCLTRLDRLASFKQTLATLVNVAATFFAGDERRQDKLDALKNAYGKVGIE